MLRNSILFCLFIIINGCYSVGPKVGRSASSLFESFYKGDEGNQYFIKPIDFKSKEKYTEAKTDFTFVYNDGMQGNAIFNFSIESPLDFYSIDSVSISNDLHVMRVSNIKRLFLEHHKQVYRYRFSSHLNPDSLPLLFSSPSWTLNVYIGGICHTFYTKASSIKKIKKLNAALFRKSEFPAEENNNGKFLLD